MRLTLLCQVNGRTIIGKNVRTRRKHRCGPFGLGLSEAIKGLQYLLAVA
jgi:hypothetical protein